jgi:hypothetical protein
MNNSLDVFFSNSMELRDVMDARYGGSLLVSQWCFLLRTPYSKAYCRNPNLGLATKVKACKVAGQEGSLGVISHVLGNAKECEGMNPRTPK